MATFLRDPIFVPLDAAWWSLTEQIFISGYKKFASHLRLSNMIKLSISEPRKDGSAVEAVMPTFTRA